MANIREQLRAESNNPSNPNYNVCVKACYDYLGVTHLHRYGHYGSDMLLAIRKKYTVRSRMSSVRGRKSVGNARRFCEAITARCEGRVVGYLVGVEGHALLLDPQGNTMVDTAPRKRDRRLMDMFYVIYA